MSIHFSMCERGVNFVCIIQSYESLDELRENKKNRVACTDAMFHIGTSVIC